jgi:predicted peroxiredoxin
MEERDMSSSGRTNEKLFVVLSASGFDNIERIRSALMFASEQHEKPVPGMPTLTQRLKEAQEMGVEVQCCSQSVINKKLTEDDLVDGAVVAGAMNLIHLSARASATISF